MTFLRKLGGWVSVSGVVLVLWALNLACAHYLHFPFAYCWIWAGLWRHLLQPFASLTVLVLALYFMWAMITSGLLSRKSLAAVAMMFLVGGADGWMRAILTLPGSSCQ